MATGRTFSFEEAQALGLVHEVFDAAEFDAKRRSVRGAVPPAVPRVEGRGAHQARGDLGARDAGFSDGLALERELQQRLFESDDAREGLAAYVERRPPKFTGR